jgi:predicted enzyme related to lactoylglutathione lyase
MTIQRTLFVLAVPDLGRSGAFYRDVLGFEVREMGDPGWRMFVRDACRIMAGACPDALPPAELGDHSYFGYLVVDDVEACHRRVVSAGAEIVKPLASESWGMREFGLRTVDGHRLMIGQEMPST